jgi:hypothetical protein
MKTKHTDWERAFTKMSIPYYKNCIQNIKRILKTQQESGMSAHTYNPSYSGGWDQKHYSSRPDKAKSSGDPISTNSSSWWFMPVSPITQVPWDQEDCNSSQKKKNKNCKAPSQQKKVGCDGTRLSSQLWREM